VLIAVQAHENPVVLASNTMLALLRHPDQLALVRDDPSLAAAAVEETLRYDAPTQLTGRTATEPLQVGDVEVPAGFGILVLLAAANRDEAVYPDADRFDVRRGATEHLAFSAGPHTCLGAGLARLQARVVTEALASRLVEPTLVEDTLAYKPNITVRGPQRMRVAYAKLLD
jgi:cytochrome P450